VQRFKRKALYSLTGARVISTLSVRIETAAIVFKLSNIDQISDVRSLSQCTSDLHYNWINHTFDRRILWRFGTLVL